MLLVGEGFGLLFLGRHGVDDVVGRELGFWSLLCGLAEEASAFRSAFASAFEIVLEVGEPTFIFWGDLCFIDRVIHWLSVDYLTDAKIGDFFGLEGHLLITITSIHTAADSPGAFYHRAYTRDFYLFSARDEFFRLPKDVFSGKELVRSQRRQLSPQWPGQTTNQKLRLASSAA